MQPFLQVGALLIGQLIGVFAIPAISQTIDTRVLIGADPLSQGTFAAPQQIEDRL